MREITEKMKCLHQKREQQALIRVQEIVKMRSRGLGFSEIARRLKISRQRIHQLKARFQIP